MEWFVRERGWLRTMNLDPNILQNSSLHLLSVKEMGIDRNQIKGIQQQITEIHDSFKQCLFGKFPNWFTSWKIFS